MTNQIGKTFSNLKLSALLAVFALLPVLAQAHPGHGPADSFASGLNHPLHGLDHILAMVAVGLWAAQMGGRSRWVVPVTFVSLMTVGGAMGMLGLPLPMVETGILVSVVAMGVLIAAAARLPLAASMALVGVFAIFHGHAHGTEIPAAASGLNYALGFILATALLHACGLGLGLLAQKRLTMPALRISPARPLPRAVCASGWQSSAKIQFDLIADEEALCLCVKCYSCRWPPAFNRISLQQMKTFVISRGLHSRTAGN